MARGWNAAALIFLRALRVALAGFLPMIGRELAGIHTAVRGGPRADRWGTIVLAVFLVYRRLTTMC